MSRGRYLDYECAVAAARAQLNQAIFATAGDEGRAMTVEQAIAYAIDESDPPAQSPRAR